MFKIIRLLFSLAVIVAVVLIIKKSNGRKKWLTIIAGVLVFAIGSILMNWPGAFCILNRLQRYADNNSLRDAINICIENAKKCGDEVWESNLRLLLHKR